MVVSFWRPVSTMYCFAIASTYLTNHVSIYVLVRYSTKNAARCDTHCELYDSVNPWEYQRIMYCRNISERLSVSVVTTFAYCMGNADIGFVSAVTRVQDALGTTATDRLNTRVFVMWMALCSDVHCTALTGTSRTRWENSIIRTTYINMRSCLHTRRI